MTQDDSYPVAWIDLAGEMCRLVMWITTSSPNLSVARVWLRIFFTATYRPRSIPSDLKI